LVVVLPTALVTASGSRLVATTPCPAPRAA
jgi:hypothetical protein